MLDIGWSELVLIGVVALIVVGPQDLPQMFRTLGRFTAKARSMAREFSSAMESAAKEAGLDEATKDLRGLTSKKALGLDALETAATKFEAWKPNLNGAGTAGTKATGAALPDAGNTAEKVAENAAENAAGRGGPATQALADKLAAKAADRANPTGALIPDPDAAPPAAQPPAASSRAPRARAPRSTAAAAAVTKAEPATPPAARRRKAASAPAAAEPKPPRRKKTTT